MKNHAKIAENGQKPCENIWNRLKLVRTSPGVPKQCKQSNWTIADRFHLVSRLTSSMSTELLKFWLFWVLVPFCLFGLRVARVVWHAAGCFHRRVQNPQNHPCRLRDTSRALLMLSISISAFERAYHPLPTRPDCDFMARCLIFHKNLIKIWWKFDSRTAKWGQKCVPGLPNGCRNALQDCQMWSKMENFEILYFSLFRFYWSILHHHLWPWPAYSPQPGSPLAFYAFYIEPSSGGGFKRFSVNGLPS